MTFIISFITAFVIIFIATTVIDIRRTNKYNYIYSLVVEAQEELLYARRLYYSARFAKNGLEQEILQANAQELYNESIAVLDDEDIRKQINELPEELRTKLIEILDSPRYPLF